jgi:hypothetical protein
MPTLEAITEVENRYSGQGGEPSLGQAFAMLQERWASGARDRETALRLAFLAWYSCSEPTWLTGLPDDQNTSTVFLDAFATLGGAQSSDVEVCFAVGLMAELFPYCIGDEAYWLSVGNMLRARARALAPRGLQPSQFSGRGAYGEYFAHMVATHKAGS